MFTGLVTHRGTVAAIEKCAAGGVKLSMSNPFSDSEPTRDGESIAVNGCCLTALVSGSLNPEELLFFVSDETLSLTTLGRLKPCSTINLERALRLGDRFGGHLVSGHVDCIGRIDKVVTDAGSACVTVAYPAEYGALVVYKGSVAVDGVSLTVNTLLDEGRKSESEPTRRFTVNIIPHTNKQTGFGSLSAGDTVNLEFDMFAKFALRGSEILAGMTMGRRSGPSEGEVTNPSGREIQHDHRVESIQTPVQEGHS